MSLTTLGRQCLLTGALFLVGCGGPHEAADPTKGADAVQTAFESWKKGETPEILHKRQPPIYLNEPEWRAGNRLLSFEVVEPLEPFGRQLRCALKLSLESAKDGAKYEKRIGYQVETNPAFVIAREGL